MPVLSSAAAARQAGTRLLAAAVVADPERFRAAYGLELERVAAAVVEAGVPDGVSVVEAALSATLGAVSFVCDWPSADLVADGGLSVLRGVPLTPRGGS